MASSVAVDLLAPISVLALVVTGLGTLWAVRRLDDGPGWGAALRRRFVLGVPWGTVVVVTFVVAVYLFVQDALGALGDPLVVPFRSWSYTYPLGMVTAPFAHGGLGHITGNLVSTVVFAPVAEYAWSHYPTERGRVSFGSVGTNPFVRIAVFVAGVLLVGLATSFFVPGPLIGFSGVVFAFAGFAIVTRPLSALLAIVGVRVVRIVYLGLTDPVSIAQGSQQYVTPWFADIAIQGHAFGLLVGVLLGATLVWRRGTRPPIRYVWYAALVFAITEALYAFYWYAGVERYLLFRGAGVAIVFVLVTLVAVAVAATADRELPLSGLTTRHVAVGLMLAIVVGMGMAAIPYGLADVETTPSEGSIEVRDYTIRYAEDVEHGYVSAISLPVIGEPIAGSARASGVIVASDQRNAWEQVVPAGRLALQGRATVSVGGLGWRERVVVNRTSWTAVGAGETYRVTLHQPGEQPHLAYTADPVQLEPTVDGLNFTIAPTSQGYVVNGTRNGTVVRRVPIPAGNTSVGIGDVTVERRGDALAAVHEQTRIRLATFQAGRNQ